jgi:hypothetical protein
MQANASRYETGVDHELVLPRMRVRVQSKRPAMVHAKPQEQLMGRQQRDGCACARSVEMVVLAGVPFGDKMAKVRGDGAHPPFVLRRAVSFKRKLLSNLKKTVRILRFHVRFL